MKKILAVVLAFLVLAVFTSLSGAQDQPERRAFPTPSPIDGPGRLVLPCCKCVGDPVTLSLSTGAVPWTVTPGSGPATTTLSPWASTGASWIQPVASGTADPNVPAGPFTYMTKFVIPDNCTIPYDTNTFKLSGTWAADNGGTLSLLGASGSPSQCVTPYCFKTPVNFSFGAPISLGGHVLTATVTNLPSSYSGLSVNATLTGRCTTKIQK